MTYIGVNAEWLKSHDAGIRKQVREKVFDKLDEKIIVDIDCHDCRMTLIKFMNELRSEP